MKTQVVKFPEGLELVILEIFKNELPKLTDDERKELRRCIKRDGVLDPVKWWRHCDTGQAVVIDGHNRKEIAEELGLSYQLQEVKLPTVNAALYWMHMVQGGRRGGNSNAGRMSDLFKLCAEERGQPVSTAQADKAVAEKLGITDRAIRKQREGPRAVKSGIDRAKSVIGSLSRDEMRALVAWIQGLIDG